MHSDAIMNALSVLWSHSYRLFIPGVALELNILGEKEQREKPKSATSKCHWSEGLSVHLSEHLRNVQRKMLKGAQKGTKMRKKYFSHLYK